MSVTDSAAYRQLRQKALDAVRGGIEAWRPQSTGEKLAVAMVLNRHDWLEEMGYTMAQAIDRIEWNWLQAIPVVARELA
jgi:hypothetical protein